LLTSCDVLWDVVTNKALNGLFIKVKAEEIQIRKNPQARVTEILKKVFDK
jgi:RNAse (barnase) inhibitor barstar